MIKALLCSERIASTVMGPPQRGLVQSAFSAAANLLLSDGSLLSLNALPSVAPAFPFDDRKEVIGLPLMPNGLLLSARAGTWPFGELQVGMPVVLGTGWLVIEALSCSLDCTCCPRWNPRIERPPTLNAARVRVNGRWLAALCQTRRPQHGLPEPDGGEPVLTLAARLCGRGPGLTPSGDDFLAGWMASGWLLHGPEPTFVEICRRITEIARQRTHVLSQCWLASAAVGDFAHPLHALLAALTGRDHGQIEHAAAPVLEMGATSGYDLLQGIVYGIERFPDL